MTSHPTQNMVPTTRRSWLASLQRIGPWLRPVLSRLPV